MGKSHIKCFYYVKHKKKKKKDKNPKWKGHQETLGGVGYAYYLDCDDGIMGVCICSNSSFCTS